MRWVLASASPRRKELLKLLLSDFEIVPATGEEKADETLSPKEKSVVLARQKAREVYEKEQGKNILAADTLVAIGAEVLGKPKDEADARRMLTMLSGAWHQVYTGVCIITKDGKEIAMAEESHVRFHTLTEELIDSYIKSGSPMDKAGAYGIQDGMLVEEVRGSYSNVVGLPVDLCREMIEQVKQVESNR